MLIHGNERVHEWRQGWSRTGRLVLLLDFDGTLAPIVERPEMAAMPRATRDALDRVMAQTGVEVAVVSGRGLADVRERVDIPDIAYAGNHGMEIEGAGMDRIHPDAVAARPALEEVAALLAPQLKSFPGAILEDKGLTLTVHYRMVAEADAPHVRRIVLDATAGREGVKVTEGKMVLEVRPDVDWHKGQAVLFLLEQMCPPAGAPVLYIGDDVTDEDAFRVLQRRVSGGEGIIIADPVPASTSARAFLRTPEEVAVLLEALAGPN